MLYFLYKTLILRCILFLNTPTKLGVMKTNSVKVIVYFFSILMLLQSCVAYYKAPVSVEEAIATHDKVKIRTIDNEQYKFNSLIREDGELYGIKNLVEGKRDALAPYVKEIDHEKKLVKILLPFTIKEVYLKNQTKTDVMNGAIIAIPIISLIIYWIIRDTNSEGMKVSPI